MLRATTACTFSISQLPKVVREWCVLYILTSKCASRHNGVQLLISHLASWLRTRRFSEPTSRSPGATNHWKNTVNRDFPTFSRICIFFLLIFSLLTLLTSAFQLSILSEVSLLNFLRTWASMRGRQHFKVPEPFISQKDAKRTWIHRASASSPRFKLLEIHPAGRILDAGNLLNLVFIMANHPGQR